METAKDTNYSIDHWFDGFSQNHRFQIIQTGSSTHVIYNSRGSVDALIQHIHETGNMDGFSLGQKRDPCTSFCKKVMSTFIPDPQPPEERSNIGITVSITPRSQ